MKWRLLTVAVVLGGCHPQRNAYLADLASPDPIRRAQAVQGLAHAGDLDDLGYLLGRVGDPDPLVRAAVAEGLGHLDDRRAADGLAELAEDPSEAVQLQAVAALGHLKAPRAKAYLLLAYRRSGSAVRAKVAESLAAMGVSPAEAVQAEARALYEEYSRDLSGSGASRLTAAQQLGRSGRLEAVERLSGYVGAESHALAISAARGLAASGAPEARPPLEALLLEDDPDLQVAGAQGLGTLGDPAAGAALVRTIQRGGRAARAALSSLLALASAAPNRTSLLCAAALAADPEIAAQAGQAIRVRAGTCPPDPFLAKLRRGSGDGSESAGALAGIAELWRVDTLPTASASTDSAKEKADPQSQFARPIAELLKWGPAEVRPFAARAATALGLSELRPDLIKARQEAQEQIDKARERWVKEPLPQLFAVGFNDPHTPRGASHRQVQALMGELDAMGVTAPDEAPGRLPSLFSGPAPSLIALWAEASAGEIRFGGHEALARLDALRSDPLARARRAAVEAVWWLPREAKWAGLTPLLEDRDPDVREAAVTMAGKLGPGIPEAGPWLLSQVQSSGMEPDVPLDALVEALGAHPELPGVTAALAAQLDQPEAAPAAIRGLLALGGPEAQAALRAALAKPRGIALDALLLAIAKLGDASEIPTCRLLLFDLRPEVRAAAVRALLALGGTKANPEVQVLAQDYDRRVRDAVASSGSLPH